MWIFSAFGGTHKRIIVAAYNFGHNCPRTSCRWRKNNISRIGRPLAPLKFTNVTLFLVTDLDF